MEIKPNLSLSKTPLMLELWLFHLRQYCCGRRLPPCSSAAAAGDGEGVGMLPTFDLECLGSKKSGMSSSFFFLFGADFFLNGM